MSEHEHYFTASPASAAERSSVSVQLAGRSVDVTVARGIFSPGGVDKGTQVLLDHAPTPPPTGTFLDLGCGWGPIALTLAMLSPAATVHAVDVNERALDLVARNAESLSLNGIRVALPDDVPVSQRFDLIWSNPPIRIGKAALHDLLSTWLPRLEAGGTAYLVVQRNLGSDSLGRWIEAELGMPCARLTSHRGFRILQVRPA